MIQLSNIKKAFNQGQSNEYWALHGIDLRLERGRVTAFRGPSGSGKTTLLTIIGCLARPTSGRVHFQDEDISGLPERFLTEIRRRHFGFIFQQFNLIKGLSALENVILPALPDGRPRRELLAAGEALLAQLKLGHRAQVKLIMISVDPARDDVKHLKEYTTFFHPEMIGATGTPDEIATLARAFGAGYMKQAARPDGTYAVDHTTATYLVGPDGRLARVLDFNAKIDDIVSAIRKLL